LPTTSKDRKALQLFVDYLNEVLNQTVTHSRLTIIKSERRPYFVVARFQEQKILPLQLTPHGWLHFRLLAFVRPDNKIIVEETVWRYSPSSDPDKEEWIFRYDYRLNPQDDYPCAHIHVNASGLDKFHFPTSRVSIEQIVAHLITEHGVKPKCTNWFDLLRASHEGFVERRSDLEAAPFP